MYTAKYEFDKLNASCIDLTAWNLVRFIYVKREIPEEGY